MNKLFLTGLIFLISGFLSGQGFVNKQLKPGIKAAEYVYKFYIPNNSNFACPPKISKPRIDTLYDFLDRLIEESTGLEEEILQAMMGADCRPYYSCRALNDLYLPQYHDALQQAGLSEMYSMLPVALSGSNPGFSAGADKAGSWQLSYITGRKFGLKINAYIDERMDVSRSTEAAVAYLKFLDHQFDGNKLLVIVSFFTSVPYVKKLAAQIIPFEEQDFYNMLDQDVRGFLVYLNTWSKWYRHFKPANTQKYIRKANESLSKVNSKDTIGFEWIARVLEMDVAFIETINPAYRAKVLLPGNQRVSFYLPDKKAELFTEKYAEIIAAQSEKEQVRQQELTEMKKRMRKGIPDPKTTKTISYTVRSGDVLGIIAQRYGVRVSSIKQWNNLRSDRINIGQELVIYVPKSRKQASQKYPVVDKKERNPKPQSDNQQIKPGKGKPVLYTVKSGDSLWLIALRFPGVSAENIMQWNGINDKISPGQKLKIYNGE